MLSGYVRMSRATPVRSRHVVVTMMARSITVERSVPALLGLARVSGLGMGTGFSMYVLIAYWEKRERGVVFSRM